MRGVLVPEINASLWLDEEMFHYLPQRVIYNEKGSLIFQNNVLFWRKNRLPPIFFLFIGIPAPEEIKYTLFAILNGKEDGYVSTDKRIVSSAKKGNADL